MAAQPASISALFARPEPAPRQRSLLEPEEGWLSFLLLAVMVLSTVWSVHQARWVEGTAILFPLAVAGLVLGMLLARSRLAAWLSLAIGVLGGLALCFVVVGGLVPPLAQIPGALLGTLAGTLGWVTSPSGAPPVVSAGQQFLLNGAEFGARIGLWTQLGASGRVSNDNAIFLLFIAYVAWLQGYIGSWALFRLHDVILAALPTGIALVTNAAYTGQAQAPFAVFFITLLLLAVSTNLASLQKRWERLAVDYPSGLLFDVTVSSFVVICLLAMLAFFGPRISDNPLSNAFWAYMGEQWSEVENASNRLFSGVNSPQSGGGGGGRDRLVLSGPVQLSQRVVMQVQADEPSYWRGATYDTWTGRDWMSSDKFPVNRTEKQAIFPQRFTLRKRVKASFEINQSRSDLIYTPDEPAQVSIPYKVFTRTGDANLADFSSLRAKKPAIPSLKYAVEAFSSTASAQDLRSAPADLPEWVKRYTQLPDTPQRVRDLSNTLTRRFGTNYDKAVAVEQFLRRYPYTLDVKPPPPDRDAVEYFLFDLKQGYCDYFATTMVVLLRAQGIPARLATGYVAGKFDNNTRKFVVTEEEAHSWPEVYFPNYGWMPFEPSGYRPPIVRPEESMAQAGASSVDCYDYGDYGEYGECADYADAADLTGILPGDPGATTTGGLYQPSAGIPWQRFLFPLFGLLAAGGGIYWLLSRLGSRHLSTRDVVRRTYSQMTFLGSLFGLRRKPSQTPLEYARSVTDQLTRTIETDRALSTLHLRDVIGPPNGAAEAIASSYVRAQYGQRDLSQRERETVVDGWRDLRWKMPLLLLRDRRN
ncbi:MAG TPA: transglutaminaseTgpA domain-containing protein [Chloroflexota bacterium]|nr:transglutaminaseTgpA domain-containing protein [Chloroflexota bacterium]